MTSGTTFDYREIFAKGLPSPIASSAMPQPKYNFILGHTNSETIPVEGLIEATAAAMRKDGPGLSINLHNGGLLGYLPLREFLVHKLSSYRGVDVTVDEIMITSGSQTAAMLINTALLEPGDTVVSEQWSYVGMLGDLRMRGVNIVGVPVDEDGMRVDALADTLAELKSEGIRPKYIYTIPTVQNPTGAIMPVERRQEMLRLSEEYGVPILEDDCYADLVYEGESVNAIRSMDDSDRVIHMGSFSKNLAPGMRLGYVVASWQILGQLLPLKGDIGTSNFGQMVTAEFFNNHYEEHVETVRTALRRKRDTMTAAISEHFGPMVKPNHPRGGIYLWVTFPDDVDTRKALAAAQEMGIGYNPGSDWAVYPDDDERNGNNCIRFCYALPTEGEIWEGIELLAQVFQRELGFPKEA